MNIRITYTRIFRKESGKNPLILEMSLIPDDRKEYGCDKSWSVRKIFRSPLWPVEQTLKGIPDGEYSIIAFLDSNRNDLMDRGEIFASNFCIASNFKHGREKSVCSLELIYPY